jgi:hypothetical protein
VHNELSSGKRAEARVSPPRFQALENKKDGVVSTKNWERAFTLRCVASTGIRLSVPGKEEKHTVKTKTDRHPEIDRE